MNNQKATKNSTLTYTLGNHASYLELDYLDFLFDFVSFFVVDLNNLCENEYLWTTTWLENIVNRPNTLREHIYYAALHSDQKLDATPVKQPSYAFEKVKPTERQSHDFSKILIRCLNLADILIILEVLTNRYQTDVIQPLQDIENEVNTLTKQLTELQASCQAENLKAALNDLTRSYLALFEAQLKSLHWPLQSCQAAIDEIAKHYHTLWQLAFENTIRTREDLSNDRRKGLARVQSIQPEIDRIWQKLFIKSTRGSIKSNEISTDNLANFRTKIYDCRIQLHKCHIIHYPEKEKSLNCINLDQTEILLERFRCEYKNNLEFIDRIRKKQTELIPMVTKIISFAKLSLAPQTPNNI